MTVDTPARLHVIPALRSDKALILRRGPTRHVASMLWDRKTGVLELGQWLSGRIYEHRCDLSPDARHMIIFAGNGKKAWTALSRAPWLTAIAYWEFGSTWFGGGAFTAAGHVFGNGFDLGRDLPDGLRAAANDAYPSGTDGFHMGSFFPAMLEARGWAITGGTRYDVTLSKTVHDDVALHLRFEHGFRTRGTIANPVYGLSKGDIQTDMPDWEWAEPWQDGLQVASGGKIWHVPLGRGGPGKAEMLHDLNPMTFQTRDAPYEGISA